LENGKAARLTTYDVLSPGFCMRSFQPLKNLSPRCASIQTPPSSSIWSPADSSCAEDLEYLQSVEKSLANKTTLCSGFLCANPKNNLIEIAHSIAERIHLAHLRHVRAEADGSFQKSEHLLGVVEMVSLISIFGFKRDTLS